MTVSAKLAIAGFSAAALLLVSGGVWVAVSSNWFAAPAPSVASAAPVVSMPAAAPIPILPRPADQTWLLSNGFPKLAPFSAIRWQGTTPQVRVDGTWYEWVALDELPITKIVADAQQIDRNDWQKRINEDLVELMTRLGHPTGQTVRLDLRDLTSGETKTFPAVAMTEANRQSIMGFNPPLAARVAPFSAIRWQGMTPQVRVNDTWYEWIALDDLPVPKIIEASQQIYRDLWQKRINEDLVALLSQMGHLTDATVKLELRDLTTGQTTILPNVAMTPENRSAIMLQNNKP